MADHPASGKLMFPNESEFSEQVLRMSIDSIGFSIAVELSRRRSAAKIRLIIVRILVAGGASTFMNPFSTSVCLPSMRSTDENLT